jgi:hypothetical protein
MRPLADGDDERVECHLIRRDMEYRLSVRSGKTVVLLETHRTPTAAAERAENLRRRAIEGQPLATPTDDNLTDDSEPAGGGNGGSGGSGGNGNGGGKN